MAIESFESFDSAVEHYQTFLTDHDLPASLLWLVRSRVRYHRNSLYVFRPDQLNDNEPHRKRFDHALRQGKNIAFCLHATYDSHSLIGLETKGLDPQYSDFSESGSHNFQILESRLPLRVVESQLHWTFTKLLVRNSRPMWQYLGWPA